MTVIHVKSEVTRASDIIAINGNRGLRLFGNERLSECRDVIRLPVNQTIRNNLPATSTTLTPRAFGYCAVS